jgi:hypothetical protein
MLSLLKKTILSAALAALLAPSIADARPAKGHAAAVRKAVSAATNVKASQVRYRSKIEKKRGGNGRDQELRVVRFRAGRATGTLKTDESPKGAPARVFDLKLDEIRPNQ